MRYRWLIFSGVLLLGSTGLAVTARGEGQAPAPQTAPQPAQPTAPQDVIARTCVGCHSNRAKAGNLSLEGYAVDHATADRDTTEKMIRKLRAGQMPPPGSRRPDPAVLAGAHPGARSADGPQPRRCRPDDGRSSA